MVIAAVVLLLGSAAGAYFFFSQSAEASSTEEDKEVAKKEKEPEVVVHYEYVELDPLVLPIVDASGVSQIISLVVSLEVSDAAAVEAVNQVKPKLKDAFIQDLYGTLSEHAVLKGGVIQVADLKTRLNVISDTVLHDDEMVHDVLLQVVQQRPI